MPPMPRLAASRITSTGKCFSSSQRSACGAIFSAAKFPRHIANRNLVLVESELHVAIPARSSFIVGIENSAPSLTPDGQREVTVLVLV